MQKVIRSSALLILVSAGMITSCGKKETPPAAESATPKADAPKPAATPVKPADAAPEPTTVTEPTKTTEPSAPAAAGEREYVGMAGGQAIVMGLSFPGGTSGAVSGWYYVEAQGTGAKQTLAGKLEDGSLVLEQTAGGQATGTFQLSANASNPKSFTGLWKAGGRVVPAKINER